MIPSQTSKPNDLAPRVDLHQAALHQAVFVRPKAAHAARKFVGEHRNCAIRKVDRRPTQPRLEIKRRSRTNVVAHVRDMDLQLPVAVRQRLDVNSIIEVTSRLAIDRYDGKPTEITAPCEFIFLKTVDCLLRGILSLSQNIRRKDMRQMMLADNNLDVHAKGIRRPKHLDNAATCRTPRRRKACNLDIDCESFERRERIFLSSPTTLLLLRLVTQNAVRRCGGHTARSHRLQRSGSAASCARRTA